MNREIIDELHRIYGEPEANMRQIPYDDQAWVAAQMEDMEPREVKVYRALPPELRTIAEFIGVEDALPHHPTVRTLYGVWDLVEWNEDEGTFGQLRDIVDDYAFDRVVMIGDGLYLDVAGQVTTAGSVVSAIGHELEGAEVVAPSLLELLRQAVEGPPPGGTQPAARRV